MAMFQCCYLAKGAKRPSHTTNTIKFDRIPFDPCNSIKRFDHCPFDQKNSTYLQPPRTYYRTPFSSDNPQEHIGYARLYIFHESLLYLGELPNISWHILFASQGWPFTKGLNVEPEGCTRKCFKY